ncbi:MAG: flagellar biosynthesis protein FlhB [Epsilonproteobacteria bacterium]|nr:flagellar biosynthesis protein FlhB [Campylobacterota bacterium]
MPDDMEKTEEPTPKRIEDAKKEGNVPRSMDVNSFITLTAALVVTIFMFSFISQRLEKLYIYYVSFIGSEITKKSVILFAIETFKEMGLMVLPIAVMAALGGIISAVMQFGFIFTTKPLIPNLGKINPIKGLKNLFSVKKLIDGIKIVLKVAIVFTVAFIFLIKFIKELPTVIFYNYIEQLIWLRDKAIVLIGVMLVILAILALIDLLIVRFQYFKSLRMSKQEIKEEFKQMEGDPQIKARIKKLQMELAKKRMMQNVPSADVVVTNPTHYAVALRYDKTKERAPRVIAKGINHLALRIKEIAIENGVQVVENPSLARELYKSCEVDEEIPEKLYQAVAEVLAYVYRVSKKRG